MKTCILFLALIVFCTPADAQTTPQQAVQQFRETNGVKGARVNLFVLTMLGKTSLVKPVLDAYPHLIFAKGPHGFSLLHHAEKGGEAAAGLYEYLSEKGLDETKFDI